MSDSHRSVDPQWSKDAAIALNSPYWSGIDETLEGDEFLAAAEKQNAEFAAFRDAAEVANSLDELSPEMQELYWKAIEALAVAGAQELLEDRLSGEDIAFRLVPLADPKADAILQREQVDLVVHLREAGRDEDARAIAALAPDEYRALAEQVRGSGDGSEP